MKFLLIRFSSIGDIVLTSLTIRCLRNKYPNAQIDFLTKPEYATIVGKHLRVDKVWTLTDSLWNLSRQLTVVQYDYVVDLHDNLRSKLLIQLLPESISVLRYQKHTWQRNLSVWMKKKLYPYPPVPEQYLQAVQSLGVQNDGQGLEFVIPKADWVYRRDLPLTHSAGYAVIAIGASYFTKRLPFEKWKEICLELQVPLVIIGGQEDMELGEQLASLEPLKIINRAGKFSIGQSASVISQSLFVIALDSSMMHIATALRKKTISIWGGTVPYLGFNPYAVDKSLSRVVEVKELDCRPCSKYGRETCPKGHFRCMKDINVQEVIAATKGVPRVKS